MRTDDQAAGRYPSGMLHIITTRQIMNGNDSPRDLCYQRCLMVDKRA